MNMLHPVVTDIFKIPFPLALWPLLRAVVDSNHSRLIICTYVTDLGMEFGLWVEPEMVNETSELFAKHPDWILQLSGLEPTQGRNQLVLDLCREEVCDYLFEKIDTLLANHPISYLKWDMNRILTEAGHGGSPAVSQQTKALYNLIGRIRNSHPDVEIESCSSGGGRIDFEILKVTKRFWASDSNDPFRQLEIQHGASIFIHQTDLDGQSIDRTVRFFGLDPDKS